LLSEKVRTRVRERIYKRFKRRAEKIGKPEEWRTIEIDGKLYEEALKFAFIEEEKLAKRGEESMLKHRRKESGPDIILRELEEQQSTPRRKRRGSNMDFLVDPSDAREAHGEACTCKRCLGAFADPNLIRDTNLLEIIPR